MSESFFRFDISLVDFSPVGSKLIAPAQLFLNLTDFVYLTVYEIFIVCSKLLSTLYIIAFVKAQRLRLARERLPKLVLRTKPTGQRVGQEKMVKHFGRGLENNET